MPLLFCCRTVAKHRPQCRRIADQNEALPSSLALSSIITCSTPVTLQGPQDQAMGGGFNGPLQESEGGRWLIGQQQKKSSDYSTLKTCYQGRLSSVKKSPADTPWEKWPGSGFMPSPIRATRYCADSNHLTKKHII